MGVAYTDDKLKTGTFYPAVSLLHCAGCKIKQVNNVPACFNWWYVNMFLFVLSRTEEYPPLLALMMRTLNIKFQMNYISSKIRELASELVKDRRYNYCEDTLLTYLEQHPTLKMQRPLIKNKRGENLDTIIIKPPSNPFSDTCIIYAHGLGSNKI